jgi:hypothetical protein
MDDVQKYNIFTLLLQNEQTSDAILFYVHFIMSSFVFKEMRACDSEVCHSTPNYHMCTVKRRKVELWIFLCLIAKILFVDTAR